VSSTSERTGTEINTELNGLIERARTRANRTVDPRTAGVPALLGGLGAVGVGIIFMLQGYEPGNLESGFVIACTGVVFGGVGWLLVQLILWLPQRRGLRRALQLLLDAAVMAHAHPDAEFIVRRPLAVSIGADGAAVAVARVPTGRYAYLATGEETITWSKRRLRSVEALREHGIEVPASVTVAPTFWVRPRRI